VVVEAAPPALGGSAKGHHGTRYNAIPMRCSSAVQCSKAVGRCVSVSARAAAPDSEKAVAHCSATARDHAGSAAPRLAARNSALGAAHKHTQRHVEAR
jgi:hypothetical protein